MRRRKLTTACIVAGFLLPQVAAAQNDIDAEAIDASFGAAIQPLLERYCYDCHSEDLTEADIDLGAFRTVAEVRDQTKVWQKVRHMLDTAQMPPPDAEQPTEAESAVLRDWVQAFLRREAEAHAGDPGPVVLRRLSNAEYNATIRDLTGVTTLDPTHEFPVDGAAGEGFTNTDNAQGMSPSLVQKYMDAAKEVAEHLVLLPDGIRFAPSTTPRDQTDELLDRIRAIYAPHATGGDGSEVTGGQFKMDNRGGGRFPIERYVEATLAERDALAGGQKSIADVARQRGLNHRYLGMLWDALSSDAGSVVDEIEHVRARWREAGPDDTLAVTTEIARWQSVLWQFNLIGHHNEMPDGPTSWLKAVNPLAAQRELSVDLPAATEGGDLSLKLVAGDAGDGNEHDYVVWQNPRLVADGLPDLPLRYVSALRQRAAERQRRLLAGADKYLSAVAEAMDADVNPDADTAEADLAALAERRELDVAMLKIWLDYLQGDAAGAVTVTDHYTEQSTNETYAFIKLWGTVDTPSLGANSSDQEVRIPGISRPHTVHVHPSPTLFSAVGWQSPIAGDVKVEARIEDVHPGCGNGVEWIVQHRTLQTVGTLAEGVIDTGGSAAMVPRTISVGPGELVSLMVGPRDGNYICDLTEVRLVITEMSGDRRVWDLAKDTSDDILAANPHVDSLGNEGVWHFYKGPMAEVIRSDSKYRAARVPDGSLLARWKDSTSADQRAELARQVAALVVGEPPTDPDSPDGQLYRRIRSLTQADNYQDLLSNLDELTPDDRFGQHPGGHPLPATDLVTQAPMATLIQVPTALATGRKLVVTARLDPHLGGEGSVQVEIATVAGDAESVAPASPIVVNDGSDARRQMETRFDTFRNLFPAAVCYSRVVPVDEVVTLTLFYRQDEHLKRLLLDDEQFADLDALWEELLYVSQEPLKYQVAFEQIRAFATQDRPDLVERWKDFVPSVDARAAVFRQRLTDTEPAHIDGLLEFADRAWRRPLTDAEQDQLWGLYQQARHENIPHEEAARLLLVRVLSSPAFLYRAEQHAPGPDAAPVTDLELASRLSYFLWSSLPDAELRAVASDGRLTRDADDDLPADAELLPQTRRMLQEPRARRLAIQFACQWLHLRDFDQNDDKNEKLYPEFESLRHDMYEETVRFFEDMIRNDGTILDLVAADHTFVNAALAAHYGLEEIHGDGWRRIDGMRGQGRGGVLGMATFLASQSGASRTSPILRGNWIYETLLGERLPRPPANVPQLPEAVPSGLTARQLIEQHSSVAECATCHAKIDPYGFALEQYDAIGRLRPDAVDTNTTLVNGQTIAGIDGLRDYLLTDRQEDVVRQFCRKLLGYALGREVQLSDEPFLDIMLVRLAENDYRFSVAVEAIVLSSQFRKVRGEK